VAAFGSLVRRLTPRLLTEQRITLPLSQRFSAASTRRADDVLVHVAEQMHGEAARRVDLLVDLAATVLVQPLRSLVRQQQANIVLGDPARPVAATRRVELTQIPGEFSLVVAAGQLQERCVQSKHADAPPVVGFQVVAKSPGSSPSRIPAG